MRSRRTHFAAGAASLLAAVACEQVFGLDEYALDPAAATTGGAATGGAGAGGDPAAAGAGGGIVPADCCLDALSPDGWTYVQMNVTTPGRPGPSCASKQNTFSQPPVAHGAEACGQCECGAPSVTCSFALLCDDTAGCGTPASVPVPCNGAIAGGDNFCRVDAVPSVGGCAPTSTGGELPGWGQEHHLCPELEASTAQTCAPGQLCADTVDARICVMMEGETDICPATFETDRYVTYRSQVDTRACSACTCGAATGSSCSGVSYHLYNDTGADLCFLGAQGGCLAQAGSCNKLTVSSTTCVSIGGLADPIYARQEGTPVPAPGSCPPAGGSPSGSFDPAQPVTVCCR